MHFNGIIGCELTGANFMLTTQFTGCAFGWTHHNNVFRACHISPAGGHPSGRSIGYGGSGLALAQRLMATGAMTNAPNATLTVFGSGAGDIPQQGTYARHYPNPVTGWVTVFGTVKGGGWRFYSQVVNSSAAIVEARRIMP